MHLLSTATSSCLLKSLEIRNTVEESGIILDFSSLFPVFHICFWSSLIYVGYSKFFSISPDFWVFPIFHSCSWLFMVILAFLLFLIFQSNSWNLNFIPQFSLCITIFWCFEWFIPDVSGWSWRVNLIVDFFLVFLNFLSKSRVLTHQFIHQKHDRTKNYGHFQITITMCGSGWMGNHVHILLLANIPAQVSVCLLPLVEGAGIYPTWLNSITVVSLLPLLY